MSPATLTLLCTAAGESASPEAVAEWLEQMLVTAHAAWPGVSMPADDFVDHLLEHASREVPLKSLHLTDLYLVASCLRGIPRAIAAFEAAYRPDVIATIRRVSAAVEVEEVLQGLRESLFVGRAESPPKIREYSGRGDLRAWLRVVATRTTLNAATRGPKDRPADSDDGPLLEAAGAGESAEVMYFRLHYEAEVKSALPRALEGLAPRERLLLRQHYVDELTLDDLARLHSVHVATIKRRLASARDALTEALRVQLRERLKLSPSELRSVLAIVQSRLHLTMRRLLPDEPSRAGR